MSRMSQTSTAKALRILEVVIGHTETAAVIVAGAEDVREAADVDAVVEVAVAAVGMVVATADMVADATKA